MAFLNQDKCYVYSQGLESSVADVTPLPDNWLEHLGEICAETLNSVEEEKEKLRSHFQQHVQRHIGVDATYKLKANIIEGLQILYRHIRCSDENRKLAIAAKIHEELSECTPGFHNRINDEVSRLYYPQTLTALLTQVRHSIVDGVARNEELDRLYEEVHTHNRFFVVAEKNGYGVKAPNPDDVFRGEIPDDKILAKIQARFEVYYNPPTLLKRLVDAINGELESQFEYKGLNCVAPGYASGEYRKFLSYLGNLFGGHFLHDEIMQESDYLILDEQGHVIDLNWKKIKQTLVYSLNLENFIMLTATELACINSMLQESEPDEPMDVRSLVTSPDRFIGNTVGLCEFLEFIDHEGHKTDFALIVNHIKRLDDCEKMYELIKIFPSIKRKRNLVEALARFAVRKGYSDPFFYEYHSEGSNRFIRMISNVEDVSFLLTCLKMMDSLKQYTILTHIDVYEKNILWMALDCQPKVRSEILALVSDLPPKYQTVILSKTNDSDCNLVMLAIEHDLETLELILPVMDDLSTDRQFGLLTQANLCGSNALMMAVQKNSKIAALILERMCVLSPEQQGLILTQIRRFGDNENALMLAANHCPIMVEPILERMKLLDDVEKTQILTDVNRAGYNALMIAIHNASGSDIVQSILEVMISLPLDVQRKVLMQVSTNNYNVLMIATACTNAEAVLAILKVIIRFTPELQEEVLPGNYKTVIAYAADMHPETMAVLCEIVAGNNSATEGVDSGKMPMNLSFFNEGRKRKRGKDELDTNARPTKSRPLPELPELRLEP